MELNHCPRMLKIKPMNHTTTVGIVVIGGLLLAAVLWCSTPSAQQDKPRLDDPKYAYANKPEHWHYHTSGHAKKGMAERLGASHSQSALFPEAQYDSASHAESEDNEQWVSPHRRRYEALFTQSSEADADKSKQVTQAVSSPLVSATPKNRRRQSFQSRRGGMSTNPATNGAVVTHMKSHLDAATLEQRRQEGSGIQLAAAPEKSPPASEGFQSILDTRERRSETLSTLKNTVRQGKTISAVLETGINSDLPGLLRAIVTEGVYGEGGSALLIPKGSRLIGEYQSGLAIGQKRVFVVWNRLIRPDGEEVKFASIGASPNGFSGMTGQVNNHFWERFGSAMLLSMLSAGSATVGVGNQDEDNSIAAFRQMSAEAFSEKAGDQLAQQESIGPTITVDGGARIRVLLAQDLVFQAPYRQGGQR